MVGGGGGGGGTGFNNLRGVEWGKGARLRKKSMT